MTSLGSRTALQILDTPLFISAGAFASSNGTGIVTVAPPDDYINGDLLIAQVSTSNQDVDTSSSFDIDGWTRFSGSPIATGLANRLNSTEVDIFYKFASGTQSSLSVAITGTGPITGRMYAFRKINPSSPVQVTSNAVQATGATTHNFPSVVTTTNNALIAMFSSLGTDTDQTVNYSSAVNSNLSNLTIVASQSFATGNGGGHAMIYGYEPTPGTTGNTVITSQTSTAAMITAALNPSIGYDTERVFGATGSASGSLIGGSSVVSVTFLANGRTTVVASDSNNIGNWYGKITTNIGNGFYVRASNVTVSGVGTFTGNTGVWEAISINRAWSLSDPSTSGTSQWVIKFEYSPNSNGNPVVATTKATLTANGSPTPTVNPGVSPEVNPAVEPAVNPVQP